MKSDLLTILDDITKIKQQIKERDARKCALDHIIEILLHTNKTFYEYRDKYFVIKNKMDKFTNIKEETIKNGILFIKKRLIQIALYLFVMIV